MFDFEQNEGDRRLLVGCFGRKCYSQPASDVGSILESVDVEAKEERLELLLNEYLRFRVNITELIAAGRDQTASVSSGGRVVAVGGGGGAAVGAAPAADEPKKEEKKEEIVESDEDDMIIGLFD